jgi:hypothetical protein
MRALFSDLLLIAVPVGVLVVLGVLVARATKQLEKSSASPRVNPRRLTEARREGLFEHLAVIVGTWNALPEAITGAEADAKNRAAGHHVADVPVGSIPMLYTQARWMAEVLDELLREHVQVSENRTAADARPALPMRDRWRALAGAAFGSAKPSGDRPV